ncbi:MAG: aldo/keto reductase [Desulfobacterales bacterium]|nr:aldo/keto reductase [Desulfobacterales bacterium]
MPKALFGETAKTITRPIPSSGEHIPVIGMGTSRTFDIGDDPTRRQQLAQVLQAFFDKGGTVIDSSPMYGSAEAVVGDLLKSVSNKQRLFAATKVWIYGKQNGIQQMQESMRRMGVDVMDLMQIHNLRDWKIHLPTLRHWKEEGKIRYIGITTSHGRSHAELEQIMRTEALDFVQFTYSIANRTVEERLLPLAADRGMATLINRPFQRGELFQKVKGKSLPDWSAEFDCRSWGQFFLKFVVSHPAVTCVIPATSKVHHMQDNMTAGFGRLPTEAMRRRMLDTLESL